MYSYRALSNENVSSNSHNKFHQSFQNLYKTVFSRKFFVRHFPIVGWLPKYSKADLIGDIIAGFTVGLTVLPQGIAYGILSGLSPNYGLYSAFIGCFVYCIFGTSPAITIGPTAIMALMTHEYGFHNNAAVAILLSLISGLIIFLAAIFQLGFLVDFMSYPVVSGFTSAAAITITVSQLKGIFGIKTSGDDIFSQLESLISHISQLNINDLVLGVSSIIVLVALKELNRFSRQGPCDDSIRRTLSGHIRHVISFISISRNAILVLLSSILVASLSYVGKQPFSRTGSVRSGIPIPSLPSFTIYDETTNSTLHFYEIVHKIGSGLVIVPLLAVIELVVIAKAFSNGKRLDATQELLALGLCNILGSFFSSIPITGSFSRTAINHNSGVRTPLGGIFTGILVMLSLQFLTPYFIYIPKASLSAVIICAVIYMVDFEIIRPMWKARKFDLIPFFSTFISCVFMGLEFGIAIGSVISFSIILFKAARPKIVIEDKYTNDSKYFIRVYPDSGLTYPAAEHVRNVVNSAATCRGECQTPVVLDCSNIRYSDFTSARCIDQLVKEFNQRGQLIIFTDMKNSLRNCWEATEIGVERIVVTDLLEAECYIDEMYNAEHNRQSIDC